ncbi:MAG: hypothetical protein IPP94_18825 [Ignavibacteria bacterium]|nr:hypothetical protein [Ignavibacteria bacterium]
MAKTQTFADKAKGKSKSDVVSYKCVVSIFDENTNSWKFRSKMVKAKDPKEIESMKG